VLTDDLACLPYASRWHRLQHHGIGLWDVIAACERAGSLDAAIRRAQAVDFSRLPTAHPALREVCCNGKTAAKSAACFDALGYQTLVLPSSSPANAQLSFEQKLVQ